MRMCRKRGYRRLNRFSVKSVERNWKVASVFYLKFCSSYLTYNKYYAYNGSSIIKNCWDSSRIGNLYAAVSQDDWYYIIHII